MRASYQKDLTVQETYLLRGEATHHLVNVIRIETGEELLLLNGKGLMVRTKVQAVSKKEIELSLVSSEDRQRKYNFDLALGMPKRDALELCLKEAVELGFRRIYLIKSAYSQMRPLDEERVNNLLISALEQSNAPYLPEVHNKKWEEIPWDSFDSVLLLDSQSSIPSKKPMKAEENLLVVGPEGGFSQSELEFLHQVKNVEVLCLPTPILRSPTAVATGAGVLIQRLLD